MIALRPYILACTLGVFGILQTNAVHASICSAVDIGQNTLAGNCYGTYTDATIRFMPTDPAAQFTSSGGYTGTGTFASPVIEQPGGFVFASALASGSLSSRGSVAGAAPGGTATASTSSDLREGALKLSGSVNSEDLRSAIANGFYAQAVLSDTLSISVPKALVDPVINFYLDIDGAISGSGSVGGGSGTVQAQLLISSANGGILYPGTNDFQVIDGIGSYAQTISRSINSLYSAVDVGDSWLMSIQLDAALFAIGNPNYSFDFSNTAQLRYELSDGITFTSGSGVLLTGPAGNSVPEPPTVLLMLLALGLTLVSVAKQRR